MLKSLHDESRQKQIKFAFQLKYSNVDVGITVPPKFIFFIVSLEAPEIMQIEYSLNIKNRKKRLDRSFALIAAIEIEANPQKNRNSIDQSLNYITLLE